MIKVKFITMNSIYNEVKEKYTWDEKKEKYQKSWVVFAKKMSIGMCLPCEGDAFCFFFGRLWPV